MAGAKKSARCENWGAAPADPPATVRKEERRARPASLTLTARLLRLVAEDGLHQLTRVHRARGGQRPVEALGGGELGGGGPAAAGTPQADEAADGAGAAVGLVEVAPDGV